MSGCFSEKSASRGTSISEANDANVVSVMRLRWVAPRSSVTVRSMSASDACTTR